MLLVSRGDRGAVGELRKMAAGSDVNGRIHARWALQGLGALELGEVLAGMKDESARVRRASVQLSEPWLAAKDAAVVAALGGMADDADAQVATQVFLAWRSAGMPGSFAGKGPELPLVAAVRKHDEAEAGLDRMSEPARRGRLVYENLCMSCHGLDGMGVKAADALLAPPLAKSRWMADNGNIAVLARILLKGQAGPIGGVAYGAGLMPPLEKTHTDAQLAEVLTYAGERWHGWKHAVTAEEVARVRQEIAAREGPWTEGELQKVGR
jgi:mono/diheme cytochrome c family protein